MDTGNANNLAIFSQCVDYCTALGNAYQPSNKKLALSELNKLLTKATNAVETAHTATAAWKIAVNNRQAAFNELPKITARVISALVAAGASPKTVKDARAIAQKITGTNRQAPPAPTTTPDSDPTIPTETKHSTSQMSYVLRTDNFHNLLQYLNAQDIYAPNEVALQISTLEDYYKTLKDVTNQVSVTYIALTNARTERDTVLYNKDTGAYNTLRDIKAYIKSAFGTTSPQYHSISSLKMSTYK
jgi:hypothetical protein